MKIAIAKRLSIIILLRSLLVAIGIFSLLNFGPRDSLAQEPPWLSYFPSVVRLQGKLTKVLKYGPPSYGEVPEKDSRLEVAFLILREPVRIKGNAASSINHEQITNVSFVQVMFPPELGNFSKYLEQDVIVAGTLTRGHRGEHFTDMVMTVKAVNPTGKPL
jgi:hypothetical protein